MIFPLHLPSAPVFRGAQASGESSLGAKLITVELSRIEEAQVARSGKSLGGNSGPSSKHHPEREGPSFHADDPQPLGNGLLSRAGLARL